MPLSNDQIEDLRAFAGTIIPASAAYGVPGADDVMLNYQSTSFHDQLYIRDVLGLKRAPEFEAWLQAQGITGPDGRLLPQGGAPLLAHLTGLAA